MIILFVRGATVLAIESLVLIGQKIMIHFLQHVTLLGDSYLTVLGERQGTFLYEYTYSNI